MSVEWGTARIIPWELTQPGERARSPQFPGGQKGRDSSAPVIHGGNGVDPENAAFLAVFLTQWESFRGAIFKAVECLAQPPISWYIGRVKQVISDKYTTPSWDCLNTQKNR